MLLGNLGVSQHGCRIVFDSKEDDNNGAVGDDKVLVTKLDKIHEEEGDEVKKEEEENVDEFNIDPEEAKVWNEGEIDITNRFDRQCQWKDSFAGHECDRCLNMKSRYRHRSFAKSKMGRCARYLLPGHAASTSMWARNFHP